MQTSILNKLIKNLFINGKVSKSWKKLFKLKIKTFHLIKYSIYMNLKVIKTLGRYL